MAAQGIARQPPGARGVDLTAYRQDTGLHDDSERGRHIPSLDGLRGLAILLVILLVILLHARVLSFGWVGVDLFFVLSGYLITGILVRAKNRPHYYRNFIARRALRILPPYYAYLTLVLLILPSLGYRTDDGRQIWAWTYLTNIAVVFRGGWAAVAGNTGHLWSVAVEEQFYIVWPIVVLACSVVQLRRVCTWGIVIAIALRVANVAWDGSTLANYVLVPARMDSLLVGAFLSLSQADSSFRKRSVAGLVFGVSALSVALILKGRGPHDPLVETIGYSSIAISAGSLLALCLTTPSVAWILSAPALRMAGRYSYTAYLWHMIVLSTIEARFGLRGWPHALTAIIVTFALSAASWYCFEAPILSLKRYFPSGDAKVAADRARTPEDANPIVGSTSRFPT